MTYLPYQNYKILIRKSYIKVFEIHSQNVEIPNLCLFIMKEKWKRSEETTTWKNSGKNIVQLTRLRNPFHLQIQSTKLST